MHIPNGSAPGCDGQTVHEAKESFKQWAPEMLSAIHTGDTSRRRCCGCIIPKPGKTRETAVGHSLCDRSGTAAKCGAAC